MAAAAGSAVGHKSQATNWGVKEETLAADTKTGTKPPNKRGGQRRQAESSRVGEVRCLNCFVRFRPPMGAEKASCPSCGWEWHISWAGKLAKIRKPVWESWEQQIAEAQQEEKE